MKKRTLMIIISVVAVAVAIYGFYSYSQSSDNAVTASNADSDSARNLSDIRRLKDLKLDTSIFQNPSYQALQSSPAVTQFVSAGSSTPVVTGRPGRPNPFLPFQ